MCEECKDGGKDIELAINDGGALCLKTDFRRHIIQDHAE
jgi:hypothetical protein